MNIEHVFCDPTEIDRYFDGMQELFLQYGTDPHFVANIDEADHSEYVDATNMMCIVHDSHEGDSMKIMVNRVVRRSSLIEVFFADGTYLKPGIVVSR